MSNVETKNGAPHIALIGGGSGSFTLLQDLKTFTPNISAIVNMSDDGGSTGRLKDEHGVLPPGDIRQCLVALSQSDIARDIFDIRFSEGELAGHSLGNLILAGLEMKYGNFEQAVRAASTMLDVVGEVIPVTTTNHDLLMRDGEEVIRGESEIGHRKISSSDARVSHDPPATVNPRAKEAIEKADIVAIAPGNLYGSLLPALAVNGLSSALQESKARKIMIANLVTKPGQTDGWHVVDYLNKIEEYVGQGVINTVLYNTQIPDRDLMRKYADDNEFPVDVSLERLHATTAEFIGAKLLASSVYAHNPADKAIKRTLIRHDAHAVGRQLMKIYYS